MTPKPETPLTPDDRTRILAEYTTEILNKHGIDSCEDIEFCAHYSYDPELHSLLTTARICKRALTMRTA